jgi:glutamine amidotransferase
MNIENRQLMISSAPAHALSKQVHEHYLPQLLSHDPKVHAEPTTEAEITERNRLFNVDGFGMTWYTPQASIFSHAHKSNNASSSGGPVLHPAVYKTIQPPLHDANFRSICASTSSTCVLAHIRAATSTAIVPVNNHPFAFGRHVIMHNGYVSAFPKVARQMANLMSADAYENIRGSTDTEHFAALYMSYLTFGSAPPTGTSSATKPASESESSNEAWEQTYTTAQMLAALQHAANTVIDLQHKALGADATPNDLNVCVTDGRQLVAMRFRNHDTEQPPSLYYSTTAGVTLNRKFPDHPDGEKCPNGPAKGGVKGGHNPRAQKDAGEHGKHVIIASEPTTYKDKEWVLIEKNHAVIVDSNGNMTVEKITYEK